MRILQAGRHSAYFWRFTVIIGEGMSISASVRALRMLSFTSPLTLFILSASLTQNLSLKSSA